MKKIRNNVFETNSSSCHSLCVSEKPNYNWTIVPDDEGLVIIPGSGFGHGSGEEYHDSLTKANYLATAAVVGQSWYDDNDAEEDDVPDGLEEKEQFYIERAAHPDMAQRLVDVIKRHTAAKYVHLVPARYNAYIDHQSQGTGEDFFHSNSDEGLRNFLFNGESYLFSDYG